MGDETPGLAFIHEIVEIFSQFGAVPDASSFDQGFEKAEEALLRTVFQRDLFLLPELEYLRTAA